MDDLQNYRQRIGLFCCGTSLSNGPFYKTSKLRNQFSYLICFLVIISLASAAQISDPSIELNPGPSQSTTDIKKFYNKCRSINSDIVRISSHRYFLKSCQQLQLIPKGMMPNASVATCKPNEDLINALSQVSKDVTFDQIDIILRHYDSLLRDKLVKDQHIAYDELRTSCSPLEYQQHCDQLRILKETETEALQLGKLKKINRLPDCEQDIPYSSSRWLPDLQLGTTEQNFILEGQQICDGIVNASMLLLNRDFPHFYFQSSSVSHNMLTYTPYETIHIHHNGEGHFCTSSSIGGVVNLYDSLNTKPSTELVQQITSLYSPDPSVTPTIIQRQIQSMQEGSLDCGLFAIAYATELAYANDPTQFSFDQASFQPHMFSCLEKRKITPFPKYRVHTRPVQSIDVTQDVRKCDKWSLPKKPAPATDTFTF